MKIILTLVLIIFPLASQASTVLDHLVRPTWPDHYKNVEQVANYFLEPYGFLLVSTDSISTDVAKLSPAVNKDPTETWMIKELLLRMVPPEYSIVVDLENRLITYDLTKKRLLQHKAADLSLNQPSATTNRKSRLVSPIIQEKKSDTELQSKGKQSNKPTEIPLKKVPEKEARVSLEEPNRIGDYQDKPVDQKLSNKTKLSSKNDPISEPPMPTFKEQKGKKGEGENNTYNPDWEPPKRKMSINDVFRMHLNIPTDQGTNHD